MNPDVLHRRQVADATTVSDSLQDKFDSPQKYSESLLRYNATVGGHTLLREFGRWKALLRSLNQCGEARFGKESDSSRRFPCMSDNASAVSRPRKCSCCPRLVCLRPSHSLPFVQPACIARNSIKVSAVQCCSSFPSSTPLCPRQKTFRLIEVRQRPTHLASSPGVRLDWVAIAASR